MALLNTIEQLEAAHTEAREVVETIRTKIENLSNVDDLNIDAQGERELIERTMENLAKVSTNQLAGLRTRLNALLPINRLPVEVFVHIILLTNTSAQTFHNPYIRYTWVCHRWRSALIQTSTLWTIVQHRHNFRLDRTGGVHKYEELLRRSKSAKLDIRLSNCSIPYISTLEKLFAEESHRICKLMLDNPVDDLLKLVLSGKQFLSLHHLSAIDRSFLDFNRLVPVLLASDSLETLSCSVGDDAPFDRLFPIFSRIRHLNLSIQSLTIALPVFEMLHNSPKLQTLQFSRKDGVEVPEPLHQVVLPELQFLSTGCPDILALFRAPKLSSLDVVCFSLPIALAFEFDILSTRYLYIRDRHNVRGCAHNDLCIIGAKERVSCGTLFSHKHDIFHQDPLTHGYTRDCFHLGFYNDEFTKVLPEISMVLRQLTSLVELYLLIPHSLDEFETLISHLPSVEKVVVQRGNKLLDIIRFLNNTPSPCPRLKYLYFKTFLVPKNLEKYANDVGRSLTKYIQLRRKESAGFLEHIILGNCPPLPENWHKKLQDLGTEVVTDQDAQNIRVIEKSRKSGRYRSGFNNYGDKFSDVEI